MDAEIKLIYKDAREAKAVARAVEPDNIKVPSGLKVETLQRGNRVLTRIQCETRLQTFMATIDDLLESVTVAENTFKAAKSQS